MIRPMGPEALSQVIESVGRSKRYRHVADAVVARLAAEELPKSANVADAEKRTKRRLHQIFGAYHTALPWDRLLTRLAAAKGDPTAFRAACAEVMRGHASTAERIPELDTFYRRIFDITGTPGSVLDLACGLNPLAIPWMGLPEGARYTACDIDKEMARFLGGFLGMVPVEGRAELNDLVAGPPAVEAEVALVLKTLPCLRHQTPDLGSILDRVRARWLVVSFPAKSLGNREKGMVEQYRAMFGEVAAGRSWGVREVLFESELVFVCETGVRAPT